MKIKWYGHSCFKLTSENGVSIVTDPCDPPTGYELKNISSEIITVSHDHHDHNYTKAVPGNPTVINTVGEHEVCGIRIRGIKSFHDECRGKKRGENIVFKYKIDGLNIVHMGDIGDISEQSLIDEIGETDVLLVPIGGIYTIDAAQARQLANKLHAKAVIPMHYKTASLAFELGDLDTFVDHAVDCSIHRLNQSEAVIEKDFLGSDRILILSYES